MSDLIKLILSNEEFIKRTKLINKLEKTREFCRHNLEHFFDTARVTYILILENNEAGQIFSSLDLKTVKAYVYAAGLLHDLGRVEEYSQGLDHAEVSSKVAETIMKQAGFKEQEIRIISTAIAEHRNYKNQNSLLGKRLYQGDKLSRNCLECKSFNECKKDLGYKKEKEIY